MGGILETIEGFFDINGYLLQGYDFIVALSYVEKLVLVLVGAIVIVLGVFELVKKLSKLIIVVAILGGLWFLYTTGTFESFIG